MPKPLPCVWMFFVVLPRGGAYGEGQKQIADTEPARQSSSAPPPGFKGSGAHGSLEPGESGLALFVTFGLVGDAG